MYEEQRVINFFSICICTYKRPHLLKLLLEDLNLQTLKPESLIIVDGDPSSGQVQKIIDDFGRYSLCYISSNHANISFQRYLGWRAAKELEADILLYLDDDIRVLDETSVKSLISPLLDYDNDFVGTTAPIIFPNISMKKKRGLFAKDKQIPFTKKLRRLFFDGGSITTIGGRVLPDKFTNEGYGRIKWAYGGVMAFRMDKLGEDSFLDDSFALHEIGCGLGEDTLISAIAARKGDILLINQAEFIHPCADNSKTYPESAFKSGYAVAYSRRLINDHVHKAPSLKDRLYLGRSYLVNNIINFINFLTSRKFDALHYALGYKLGAIKGIINKPTAKNLTPDIDWWVDAETALSEMGRIE